MKKVCTQCGVEKFLGEFTKDKSRKDGYYHACKACKRVTANQRYHTKEKTDRRAYDGQRSAEGREMINAYKASGCMVCRESSIPCLDLHHRDPTEKEFTISSAQSMSRGRIAAELEKCVVLCATCHRKVHADLLSLLFYG